MPIMKNMHNGFVLKNEPKNLMVDLENITKIKIQVYAKK